MQKMPRGALVSDNQLIDLFINSIMWPYNGSWSAGGTAAPRRCTALIPKGLHGLPRTERLPWTPKDRKDCKYKND